jgi:hypothetical protein
VGSHRLQPYAAEIGPARPSSHANAATRAAILKAADADFAQGIRVALAVAIALLVLVLVAGFVWFPRGQQALADAGAEAARLRAEEAAHGEV